MTRAPQGSASGAPNCRRESATERTRQTNFTCVEVRSRSFDAPSIVPRGILERVASSPYLSALVGNRLKLVASALGDSGSSISTSRLRTLVLSHPIHRQQGMSGLQWSSQEG